MRKVLITGAGGSAAENFIQSLRLVEDDYFVVGADANPHRLHLSSADERIVLPRVDEISYIDNLESALTQYSIDVLHAQPDKEVMFIGQNRESVSAKFFLPPQRSLEVASDKALFAQQLAQRGIAVPNASEILSEKHLRDVVQRFKKQHDRLWVRARTGAGSKASLPVSTYDQALSWIRWWVDERGMAVTDFMVSEMLPGREFAYQSIWQDGQLVVGQTRERMEYLYGFLSPSGQSSTPSIARTVSSAAIDELAQAAIKAICEEPHGVFCVDMKEDAFGQPRVTEVNAGRFFTTSNFFSQAGLNMPEMSIRAALGQRLERLGTSPLEPNLYWIRMVDMGYALVAESELVRWTSFKSEVANSKSEAPT